MKTDNQGLVRSRLRESLGVKQQMLDDPRIIELLDTISNRIIEAYRNDKKVLIFGNGGSAADSQHIAAELVGKYYLVRDPLPAIALTVNTSSLTALGNDFSYDDIFLLQMRALGRPGDVAIGISTSGNSPNVVKALQWARTKGLVTVGFTGAAGGALAEEASHCLRVPSDDTPRIQEAHITAGHIICEIVEATLFGGEG